MLLSLITHIISLGIALSVWIFMYLNSVEKVEIVVKAKVKSPKDFTVISKLQPNIKVLIATNRKFIHQLFKEEFEVEKKIKVKGKIFPKKFKLKISPNEFKLPEFVKIIQVVNEPTIHLDILKEALLPVKTPIITYQEKPLDNIAVSVEPSYINLKLPSGFLRITKAIELPPIKIDSIPQRNITYKIKIPDLYLQYIQFSDLYVDVTISPLENFNELILNIPVKIMFSPKANIGHIKSLKVIPELIPVLIKYRSEVSIAEVKNSVICFGIIKKGILYSLEVPVHCSTKDYTLQDKIKILEIYKPQVRVKFSY
jgi:hypothetical protein